MTQKNFCQSILGILMVLAVVTSRAQDDVGSYKVGERIEYRDNRKYDSATSSYPVVWLEGTVVKLSPENKQVIIRWDPRSDYPSYTHNGVSIYEAAYNIAELRHIKPRTANNPGGTKDGARATATSGNNARKDRSGAATRPRAPGGTGLMTKAEILGYIRTYNYVNGQPKRDQQVFKDLIEQMKRRGVKEPFTVGKDDLSPIYSNGGGFLDTDVVGAAQYNVGPPTTFAWLSGTWLLYVIGGTVDTAPGDGYIYRKNESIAKLGFLTINGNGTYIWKVNPWDLPNKYIKGTWRKATEKEMQLQGGAGIVLQKAAEGADWIAYKYMLPAPNKADRIDVQHLQSRGAHRRIGWRK